MHPLTKKKKKINKKNFYVEKLKYILSFSNLFRAFHLALPSFSVFQDFQQSWDHTTCFYFSMLLDFFSFGLDSTFPYLLDKLLLISLIPDKHYPNIFAVHFEQLKTHLCNKHISFIHIDVDRYHILWKLFTCFKYATII